ncbi:hypothetical protein BDW42DRAFT_197674 [Aspergillus taichungensis]|uniref:Cyanovirin-N domain-containing protein n=1 Tax=Aspergillus taichungensis TaxID=482145 RepID=A0A2J5HF99_9EURO|nr:hypothetical protein BDW42DRAFT_197674 [Aspergillus taichungensis]
MKPTTALLALLAPLAATAVRVCNEGDVAIGFDSNKQAAMIANDCNAFHSIQSTDVCVGWDGNHQVRCMNNNTEIDVVKIRKEEAKGFDFYSICTRLAKSGNQNQCDNGVEVKWCCGGHAWVPDS